MYTLSSGYVPGDGVARDQTDNDTAGKQSALLDLFIK